MKNKILNYLYTNKDNILMALIVSILSFMISHIWFIGVWIIALYCIILRIIDYFVDCKNKTNNGKFNINILVWSIVFSGIIDLIF